MSQQNADLAVSQEVTGATFESAVLEASKRVPVLVDFWAPWCGPCRALTPVLEKLAQDYDGRFVLAKVNSDKEPELAARYGIRSIPNVKAFSGGQVVDEFVGALPESAVREFIDGIIPTPAELTRREALASAATGDNDRALELLATAAELEPRNDAVHADRAELLLLLGRTAEAQEALARLSPLAIQEPRIARIAAKLQLSNAGTADETTLTARVASDPGDLEARLALAKLHAARQQYEAALDELLEVVRRDRSFGEDAGRKTMLALFDLLGADHDIVKRYRRLLATALN